MIIAPSVLALDYSRVNEQISELNESKAEWIHFDVMDGHFVPNLTFGPDILKGMKKLTTLLFDVHIMVCDPEFYADVFIDAGANCLTFHIEALENNKILPLISRIKDRGVMAGISIKPNTDIECLRPFIEHVDLVLLMSVEPGFGGQSFDHNVIDKIKIVQQMSDEYNSKLLIEIDGGINDQTAKLCKEAGADVLVSGSYIFKGDIKKQIESLF